MLLHRDQLFQHNHFLIQHRFCVRQVRRTRIVQFRTDAQAPLLQTGVWLGESPKRQEKTPIQYCSLQLLCSLTYSQDAMGYSHSPSPSVSPGNLKHAALKYNNWYAASQLWLIHAGQEPGPDAPKESVNPPRWAVFWLEGNFFSISTSQSAVL